MNRFMRGAPLLTGSHTVPGQQLTQKEKEIFVKTMELCSKYGCDFYPTIIQKLVYDEMSEIAAYGGFPRRFPHWKWGMEYEELQRGYEYNQYRIYEMVINCLKSDVKISTAKGYVEVSDIKVGDIVYSRNGSRRVVHVAKQPVSEVVKLVLKDFGQDTVCSLNHKWLVLRGWQPVWVEARQLKDGDVLLAGGRYENYLGHACPIVWDSHKVYEATLSNVRWRLEPIHPPSQMTLELAELMGICTGDGSDGVSGAENALAVGVGYGLDEYLQHVAGLFTSVFNKAPGIYEKTNGITVQLNSKYAVDYMDGLGLKKGVTFESKRVPQAIFDSSNEYRAAFLRGLFDTDGHCKTSLSMSSRSEGLVKDTQLLLLELGIRSKISHVVNDHNDIWVLYVTGRANQVLFAKHVGFSLGYKKEALERRINAGYAIAHGLSLPGVQEEIVRRVKSLKSQRKLPAWIKGFVWRQKNSCVGANTLWSFVTRMISAGYDGFEDLLDLLETPMYAVQSVEPAGKEETYDIALKGHHDFLANGLISHNTNPCIIYILNSNTLVDNVTVVAHATFHNDFFKNNLRFSGSAQNMVSKLGNHGSRIQKYMDRWGQEKVTEFIDHVIRIQTLIDPAKAWDQREIKDHIIRDSREYELPRRLPVDSDRLHMDPWMNTKEWKDHERERIKKLELSKELGLFKGDDKDVMGFVKDNAPLKPWQADIMSMLYEEAIYFAPQRATKTINEGWASFGDYEIMTRQGHVGLGQKTHDAGIIEYAVHKMGVLGGKYSMNPYKIGFYLLLDIEERWNKGQFGSEWENCKDLRQKENWDLNLGLGKEKLFEVRKYHDDVTFISEFFTQEFCDKFEFFEWKHYPNGEYRIESRDAKKIKKKLLQRHLNGGLPDIRLTDPNHRNRGWLLLEHWWDGRLLHEPYAREVLTSLNFLWGKEVVLVTKDHNNQEVVFICVGQDADKDVALVTREEYENKW